MLLSFWAELKRRKVVQVATVYAVVAWLLVQIVSTVEGPLGLPGWFDTAIILLLAVGFPVAVIFAWAYDLSPDGLRVASARSGDNARAAQSSSLFVPVTQVLVLLAVGFLIVDQYLLDDLAPSTTAAPARNSVSRLLVDIRPAEALIGSNILERSNYGRSVPSRRALAIAPDGRTIAFTARRGDRESLYLRRLDEDAAIEIDGTEGADSPFFSPDGETVAYWAEGALWRTPVAGGGAVRIVDTNQPWGASWTEPESIVFSNQLSIWSVSPDGGEATQLTQLSEGNEVRHAHPRLLPGGGWLLYTSEPRDFGWDRSRIVAISLSDGEERILVEGAADARYVAGTGHLVYMRLGALMASPFDVEDVRIAGGEARVVDEVFQSVNMGATPIDTGAGQFDISSDGTLAYIRGKLLTDHVGTVVWVDRDGSVEELATAGGDRPFFSPSLSPDGKSMAISTFGLHDHSIFRYDFATGVLDRLTFEGWGALSEWSPDGRHIAINLADVGARNVYLLRPDGEDLTALFPAPTAFQAPGAWAPDGRSLVFMQDGDFYLWSQNDDAPVRRLTETPFRERHPALSPDGKWLAYVTDEGGRPDVRVAPFPGMRPSRQVSARGGTEPAWSRDGRVLVYLEPVGGPGNGVRMVALDVTLGDEFLISPPEHVLFDIPWYSGSNAKRGYDIASDAQRFLFVKESYEAASVDLDTIHIVQNSFKIIADRAPTP